MTTFHRRQRPPYMVHQDQGRHDDPPLALMVFA